MKEREFIGFLAENGLLLSERQIFRLERYQQLLEEKNREINLTAITEKEEVFEKHFLDSLLFLSEKTWKTSGASTSVREPDFPASSLRSAIRRSR